MEDIIDFDKWASTNVTQVKFVALFDPDTGSIKSVGPDRAFINEKNIIELETEIAEEIIEGKIKLHNCFVDINEQKLEIAEVKQVYKIDDVLHRITFKKWTDIEKPDIYIKFNNNKFIFQLTEEFGGTYKQDEKFQPIKKRKILWDGDTDLNFLITDYNDPNILYKMITIKLNELIDDSKEVIVEDLPEKFSIYTRRIFKDYVIE